MKELDLKHLEKLYLFDYCKKNKCKIIYGDKTPAELRGMYQAKLKLSEFHVDEGNQVPEQLKELYADDLKKFQAIQEAKALADKQTKKNTKQAVQIKKDAQEALEK